MKKRQELATQMQIEAVKDVREEINGCNFSPIKDIKPYPIFTNRDMNLDVIENLASIELLFRVDAHVDAQYIFPIAFGGVDGISIEFNGLFSNSNKYGAKIITRRKQCWKGGLYFGTTYHIVGTFDKSTNRLKLYVDGVLVNEIIDEATTTQVQNTISIGGHYNDVYPHKGMVYLGRVYNYVLSQSEVTALYNNGNPQNYILDGNRKDVVTYDCSEFELWPNDKGFGLVTNNYDGLNGFDMSKKYLSIKRDPNYNYKGISTYSKHISNAKTVYWIVKFKYRSSVPFRMGTNGGYVIIPPNINNAIEYTTILKSLSIGSNRPFGIATMDNYTIINGCVEMTNDDFVEIQPISATEIGCIAEYLPQNLISTSDGEMNATTAIKWLDSAKQLPDNDEYLEPLLESIGGYDLTASGEPEIVYKSKISNYWYSGSPMTLDGWGTISSSTMAAVIKDNAIKVPYPEANNMQYKNGVYRFLPFDIPSGKLVTLRFKAKADTENARIMTFVGIGAGGLHIQKGATLTQEWETYETVSSFDTSSKPVLTSIGFYPQHNITYEGHYYIKDIEVIVYDK